MPDVSQFAATVEDYDSDEAIGASAVRNKSSFVPPAPSPRKTALDAASDSGYSSRTAATLGSADSAEAPIKAIPKSGPASSTTEKPRPSGARSSGAGGRKQSSSSSSSDQKPLLRAPSRPPSRPTSRTTARRFTDEQFQRCAEPTCKECTMSRKPQPPPPPSPLDPRWARPPSRPSPSPLQPHYSAPSPHPYGQPAVYQPMNVPVLALPQPRRRATAQPRPRPLSYHPGATPDGYWVAVAPTSPYEHGPPPSPSAYVNPTVSPSAHSPYAHPQYAPSGPIYAQRALPYPQLPPASSSRPTYSSRPTDGYYRPARPTSMYGTAPQVSYDPSGYNQALVRRSSSSRRSVDPPAPDLYYYKDDIDRQRMPPPARPREGGVARNNSQRSRDVSRGYSEDCYDRDRRSDSSGSDPDATISVRPPRPTIRTSETNPRQSSYEKTKADARDYIDSSRSRRRSYASHEQSRTAERRSSTDSEFNSDQSRVARTMTRPARLTEEALEDSETKWETHHDTTLRSRSQSRSRPGKSQEGSNTSKSGGGEDGFKIEVDRKGMNLNLGGQRISVMPREGGTAELIITGGQKHRQEARSTEDGRSMSSGSNRRVSRSSKGSSDMSAAKSGIAGESRASSSRATRGATTSSEEK